MNDRSQGNKWVRLVAGLIFLLGVLHFVVLALQYHEVHAMILSAPARQAGYLADAVLFSAGVGFTLLLGSLGVLYASTAWAEKSARVITLGVVFMLGSFGLAVLIFQGPKAPITYVHWSLAALLLLAWRSKAPQPGIGA